MAATPEAVPHHPRYCFVKLLRRVFAHPHGDGVVGNRKFLRHRKHHIAYVRDKLITLVIVSAENDILIMLSVSRAAAVKPYPLASLYHEVADKRPGFVISDFPGFESSL